MYPNNTYYPQVPYQQPVYPNNNFQNQTPKFNMNNQYQDNNKNSDSINLIYVKDYDSAKDVILQPNQRAWIMNTNCQEFYIKTSDSMGVSTLDCYQFTKFDPKTKEINLGKQDIDYIKRAEFDALKSKIEALEKNISTKPKLNKKADD
jgi:uncharacterized protein YecT (DUF1311 family)